jgi:hypothetical protein
MRWVWYVAEMREIKEAQTHRISVVKPEEKIPLGRTRHR